jgi:mRNA interferase MazF
MKYGEIWLVNFSPQIGDEISKMRPAIIISPTELGKLSLKLVVPVTKFRENYQPWHLPLAPNSSNNLDKKSLADCFQIKSISDKRFQTKIGVLTSEEIVDLKLMIIRTLNLM